MMARTEASALERWVRGVERWPGVGAEQAAAIGARVLVLRGEDDALLGGEALDGASFSDGGTQIVEDAGHALTLEAFAATTRAILDHLRAS